MESVNNTLIFKESLRTNLKRTNQQSESQLCFLLINQQCLLFINQQCFLFINQ